MKTWLCITNAEGTVLAVYGSALGDEAEAKYQELCEKFPGAVKPVAVRSAKRPRVGEAV